MSTYNFKWDDKKVSDFVGTLLDKYHKGYTFKTALEEFKKASHVSVSDWEITEIRHLNMKDQIITDKERIGSLVLNKFGRGWFIHSIRRVGDSSVWVVGEETKQGIIEKFTIEPIVGMKVNFTNKFAVTIVLLEKLPPPEERPVLMTSEDNKAMYAGDDVWGVSIYATGVDLIRRVALPFGERTLRMNRKWFSSHFAAMNYAINYKPILSVNDVKSMYADDRSYVGTGWLIDKLKELAQSKLK